MDEFAVEINKLVMMYKPNGYERFALYFTLGNKKKITKLGKCIYVNPSIFMEIRNREKDTLVKALIDACGLKAIKPWYNDDTLIRLISLREIRYIEIKFIKETSIQDLIAVKNIMGNRLLKKALMSLKC